MKRQRLLFSSLSIVAIILLLSFSSTPPPGRTGAPDELSCEAANCHGGNVFMDGDLQISGFPAAAVASQTFPFSVTLNVTSGQPMRGGFQLTILGGENPTQSNPSGNLFSVGTITEPGISTRVNEVNRRQYLEHAPAQQFQGNSQVTYTGRWNTPTVFDTDSVIVYASAVLADGNGSNTGDAVIFGKVSMFVPQASDNDMDGFNSDVDCDDNDPNVNPDQTEIPNNDIDEDCDSVVLIIDEDMDGFNSDVDCDDFDATIHPNVFEIPNNDIDENCDGVAEMIDEDMDGFNSDDDCDDNDPNTNPGAPEIANNDVDENCDGIILIIDADNDGFNSDEDCDDNDPNINPNATDILDNGIDEDCDGVDASSATTATGTITDFLGRPISGVVFTNSVTGQEDAVTDQNGNFSLLSSNLQVVYTLSKPGDTASGLSVSDLTVIKRHILAIQQFPSAAHVRAADVNESGTVSANDLTLIKAVILGARSDFFGRPSWNFEPGEISMERDLTGVSVVGYKLGDVNASGNN